MFTNFGIAGFKYTFGLDGRLLGIETCSCKYEGAYKRHCKQAFCRQYSLLFETHLIIYTVHVFLEIPTTFRRT
jgi:hypothetical protein